MNPRCFGSAVLMVLCSAFAEGAAPVQSTNCQDWSNYPTTYQCSFSKATTSGNAIIVFALVSGGSNVIVTTISDDHSPASNAYRLDLHYLFGDVQNTYFYSAGGAGSASTITLTANTSTHFQVVMMEVKGLLTSSPLVDRTSTYDNGYNTGMTFTTGATPETSQAEEFLVGWSEQAYPNVMTFTDDSPWTLVQQLPLGGSRIACRTTMTKGAFAYTGRFTGDGNYRVGAAIVTYKAASERGGSNPAP